MKSKATAVLADEAVDGLHYRAEITVTIDGADNAQEIADNIKDSAVIGTRHAAFAASMSERIAQGSMQGMAITRHQLELAEQLEKEVEQTFGDGAGLYGRAVALYAVRDMLGVHDDAS